jgi:hypothetical protein
MARAVFPMSRDEKVNRARLLDKQARAALREKNYDSEDLQVGYSLTSEEKELCQNIVVFGPEYLRHQKGWKKTAIQRFMERSEIRREIETLQKQYGDRAGLQERTQFLAQLRINSMVPTAINVLARALRGEYTHPETGKIVEPPSKGQFEAAQIVLDRANVQGVKWGGHDTMPSIDARSVNLLVGGESSGPALDAAGREKVRSILSSVVGRARAMVDAEKKTKKTTNEEQDAADG